MDKGFTEKGVAFLQVIAEGRGRGIGLVTEFYAAYLICQGNGEVKNLRGGETDFIPLLSGEMFP